MSFEGYYEFLCINGHHYSKDCYDESIYMNDDKTKCDFCGAVEVWRHIVDQTNGEEEVTDLEIKTQPISCTCNECNNTHIAYPATYHIPNGAPSPQK